MLEAHLLPDDVRIEDVARRARHAASVFLASATHRWGRARLRGWLIVEYGMATEWTREDDVAPWLHSVAAMDDAQVHALVEDIRKRVTGMVMRASSSWSDPSFATEMLERGAIACVTDATGRTVYAPAARDDLALLERVGSLFVADYLTNPNEYERVSSCETCGEVLFSGRLRHSRACVRQSGMRPRAQSGVSLRESIVTTPSSTASSIKRLA